VSLRINRRSPARYLTGLFQYDKAEKKNCGEVDDNDEQGRSPDGIDHGAQMAVAEHAGIEDRPVSRAAVRTELRFMIAHKKTTILNVFY